MMCVLFKIVEIYAFSLFKINFDEDWSHHLMNWQFLNALISINYHHHFHSFSPSFYMIELELNMHTYTYFISNYHEISSKTLFWFEPMINQFVHVLMFPTSPKSPLFHWLHYQLMANVSSESDNNTKSCNELPHNATIINDTWIKLLTIYLYYSLDHYCTSYIDHYRMNYHCTKINQPSMRMDSQTSVDLPMFQIQKHQLKTFLWSKVYADFFFFWCLLLFCCWFQILAIFFCCFISGKQFSFFAHIYLWTE